jgi:pentatricopeptide repeat protein
MSPQAAFTAGFKHAEQDRGMFDARAYWLSSSAIRNLIGEGRLEEAATILREMRRSAKFLLAGSGTRLALGRRMHATAQELFALLVSTRQGQLSEIAQ